MMAPACPIRRPLGAVCPAMKPTTGLRDVLLHERGGVLLVGAADLAHHDDGVGLGVVLEGAQAVDEVGADDRIAADADAGALPDAGAGEVVDHLVGERAAARHQADPPRACRCCPGMMPTLARAPGAMSPGQLGR